MKRLLISLAILAFLPAMAQMFDFVNDGPVRWQCVEVIDGEDIVISNHTAKEKALGCMTEHEALYPGREFLAVSKERIRVVADWNALAQVNDSEAVPAPLETNSAPVWNQVLQIDCSEGVASSSPVLIPGYVVDPESDTITLADASTCGGSSTLPTGVTVNDTTKKVDCSTGTSAGVTTACTIDATDAAGSNITVASSPFTVTVAAAGGGAGFEDILADMVGFADYYSVTGGAGGDLVTVTNLQNSGAGSLRQALADANSATWIRFAKGLSGTIQLNSPLDMEPDVTIDGRGANIVLRGPGGSSSSINARYGDTNFVIMYITLNGPVGSNNDLMQVDNTASHPPSDPDPTERFWIYHVSFLNSEDELFSIRRGHGQFTVQSSYFENLTGSGYSNLLTNISSTIDSAWDTVTMETTWTRNVWISKDRLPRLSVAGHHHSYNNYHKSYFGTAIFMVGNSTTVRAQLLLENDIFDRDSGAVSTNATKYAQSGLIDGWIKASGNLSQNGDVVLQNNAGSVFTPPYTYTEIQTADTTLRTALLAEAGTATIPCFPGDTGC